MKRALVVAFFALSMLSSCQRCTLKLVVGELAFVLPDAEASALTLAPSTIETCIDGTCWSDDLDETGQGSITIFNAQSRELAITRTKPTGGPNGARSSVPAEEKSDVSLTISRDGGTVFTRQWADAEFVSTEPNGQGCGELYLLKSPLTF